MASQKGLGLIVGSLTKKELDEQKQLRIHSLTTYQSLLKENEWERFGGLSDSELHCFIQMDRVDLAIIGMALLFLEDHSIVGEHFGIDIHI